MLPWVRSLAPTNSSKLMFQTNVAGCVVPQSREREKHFLFDFSISVCPSSKFYENKQPGTYLDLTANLQEISQAVTVGQHLPIKVLTNGKKTEAPFGRRSGPKAGSASQQVVGGGKDTSTSNTVNAGVRCRR